MITTIGLSTKFLKKEKYSGSFGGMRFLFEATGDNVNVYIYPEPFCFEQTPDDQKIKREFSFSQEGLEEAVSWLKKMYETDQKRWEEEDNAKMARILKK